MKVAVIGSGYVGLVSGTCFADFGHHVTCVDKDIDKIHKLNQGQLPFFEPKLEAMVIRNQKNGCLRFTSDIQRAVSEADVVFIAVGTPSVSVHSQTHAADVDMRFVFGAAKEFAPHIQSGAVIVTKSTVPLGTGEKVRAILAEHRDPSSFDVVSNPEFLREGAAVDDFMNPDRIIIGCETDRAYHVMAELYHPLVVNDTPFIRVSLQTAEMIKYASNGFLATKIAFINEIADLAEKTGANVEDVARGMGMDSRIGPRFLKAGPGYGGSCFPKDTRAMIKFSEDAGAPMRVLQAVQASNEMRKKNMVTKIMQACGGAVKGQRLAIWGTTFKAQTDDMRESASLTILPALRDAGADLVLFDPEGRAQGQDVLLGMTWADDMFEACERADAVVILTEWNCFRAADLRMLKTKLAHPRMIDLRNLYEPDIMRKMGFHYVSLGRPAVGALT